MDMSMHILYVYMYVYVCVYVYVYVYVYFYLYVYVYVYEYAYAYIYKYIYMYIYVYVYLYVYLYVIPAQNRLPVPVSGLWHQTASANPFLAHSTDQWVTEETLRLWGPQFEAGVQHMVQFVQNRNWSCFRLTDTCSHISSIHR